MGTPDLCDRANRILRPSISVWLVWISSVLRSYWIVAAPAALAARTAQYSGVMASRLARGKISVPGRYDAWTCSVSKPDPKMRSS